MLRTRTKRYYLVFIGILMQVFFISAEEYTIKTTWNNQSIDHPETPVTVQLLKNDEESFKIIVNAPFFNDPVGPPKVPNPQGEPLFGLWNLELIKLFFVNDQNQYLEVQLGAWGHHWVLLLNGYRNAIQIGMLIDYSATRQEKQWQGTAIIPVGYLPPRVTKMNIFAYRGPEDKRITEALYPAPSTQTSPLDDHNMANIPPFDSKVLRNDEPARMSPVWSDAISGARSFRIAHTWDGKPLTAQESVNLRVRLDQTNTSLVINVDAPFYKDPAPDKTNEGPFHMLYTYEVVHLYFLSYPSLNYVEIELGPWGHYLVAFWNGYYRSVGNLNSQITYVAERNESHWNGKATVPLSFFPPMVYLFNAHSGHGKGTERKSNSLYPVPPDTNRTQPDFHLLEYYKFFDFSVLYPENENPACSKFWGEMTDNCPKSSAEAGLPSLAMGMILVAISISSHLLG